jgi:hypothetical protein
MLTPLQYSVHLQLSLNRIPMIYVIVTQARLTVPNGWNVIRHISDDSESGPSDDDLMAIADAVREVAQNHHAAAAPAAALRHSQVLDGADICVQYLRKLFTIST